MCASHPIIQFNLLYNLLDMRSAAESFRHRTTRRMTKKCTAFWHLALWALRTFYQVWAKCQIHCTTGLVTTSLYLNRNSSFFKCFESIQLILRVFQKGWVNSVKIWKQNSGNGFDWVQNSSMTKKCIAFWNLALWALQTFYQVWAKCQQISIELAIFRCLSQLTAGKIMEIWTKQMCQYFQKHHVLG